MSGGAKCEIFLHPEHGELPARRLLDCVFVLTPKGRILHFHVEQTQVDETADGVRYVFTDTQPQAERARCQIIPPFVTAFGRS